MPETSFSLIRGLAGFELPPEPELMAALGWDRRRQILAQVTLQSWQLPNIEVEEAGTTQGTTSELSTAGHSPGFLGSLKVPLRSRTHTFSAMRGPRPPNLRTDTWRWGGQTRAGGRGAFSPGPPWLRALLPAAPGLMLTTYPGGGQLGSTRHSGTLSLSRGEHILHSHPTDEMPGPRGTWVVTQVDSEAGAHSRIPAYSVSWSTPVVF